MSKRRVMHKFVIDAFDERRINFEQTVSFYTFVHSVLELSFKKNDTKYQCAMITSFAFANYGGHSFTIDGEEIPAVQTQLEKGVINMDIDPEALLQDSTFKKAVYFLMKNTHCIDGLYTLPDMSQTPTVCLGGKNVTDIQKQLPFKDCLRLSSMIKHLCSDFPRNISDESWSKICDEIEFISKRVPANYEINRNTQFYSDFHDNDDDAEKPARKHFNVITGCIPDAEYIKIEKHDLKQFINLYVEDETKMNVKAIAAFAFKYIEKRVRSKRPDSLFYESDLDSLNLEPYTSIDEKSPVFAITDYSWVSNINRKLAEFRAASNRAFSYDKDTYNYVTVTYKENSVSMTFSNRRHNEIKKPCFAVVYDPDEVDDASTESMATLSIICAVMGLKPERDDVQIIRHKDIVENPKYKQAENTVMKMIKQAGGCDMMESLCEVVKRRFNTEGLWEMERKYGYYKAGLITTDINPYTMKDVEYLDRHNDDSDDDKNGCTRFKWDGNKRERDYFIKYHAYVDEQKPILERLYDKICKYGKEYSLSRGDIYMLPFEIDEDKHVPHVLFDDDKIYYRRDDVGIIFGEYFKYQELLPKEIIDSDPK